MSVLRLAPSVRLTSQQRVLAKLVQRNIGMRQAEQPHFARWLMSRSSCHMAAHSIGTALRCTSRVMGTALTGIR